MKTILQVMAATFAVIGLAACALLAPMKADGEARYAAKVALSAYEVTQRAALIYGNLNPCDPDPKSAFERFCRDAKIWAKIKAADKAATTAINEAAPVLNAREVDTGQIVRALAAIATVKAAVDEALTQIKGPKVPASST